MPPSIRRSYVETELNGLFTYDRAVLKPEANAVKAANQHVFEEASKLDP